jgi:NAD(P)-dependent dehydrogenase (short-subunit alcohol dehydrogenase family)
MTNSEKAGHILDPLFSLAGKVALVTGGARGVGRMIAEGMAAAGARLVISSRDRERCEQAAAELSEKGPCVGLAADLSTAAGCEALAREVTRREERLHILVNNSGATWGERLEDFPEHGFDKVFDLNVKGVFFLTRELLPLLERAAEPGDPARVLNIGSLNGLSVPRLPNYSYAASKAAVHHLTRMLAVHLGPRGIAVNALALGPFESRMMRQTLEEHRGEFERACPLGRIGAPSDVAGAAVFLASRAASWISGAVLPVDGGLNLV